MATTLTNPFGPGGPGAGARVAAGVALGAALLTGCSPTPDAAPDPVETSAAAVPSTSPTQDPAPSVEVQPIPDVTPGAPGQPPVNLETGRFIRPAKVSERTIRAWAGAASSYPRDVASMKPGVDTGLCVAVSGPTFPWYGLREVTERSEGGYLLLGLQPGPDAAYSCERSQAAVVVDLATGEAVRGADLWERVQRD